MKITEQVASPNRGVILITNGLAVTEFSEFLEHIQNRINLDYRLYVIA